MDRELWQKNHLKKVLSYHNETYGTHFALQNRCKDLFPELAASQRWDWVCLDSNTNIQAAIEVKRITKESKHREYNVLEKTVCSQLESTLSKQLRGTYRLLISTDAQVLNLQGNTIGHLSDVLSEIVQEEAPKCEVGRSHDLSDLLQERLPEILPPDVIVELSKIKNETSILVVELMTGGSAPSGKLEGQYLDEFKRLIKHANQQLHEAKNVGLPTAFLVLLDLMYFLMAEPDVIQSTYHEIEPDDRDNIDYAYYVQNAVTQIAG